MLGDQPGRASSANGTNNDSNVPLDVSGLTSGVAEVSAGAGHTCALTVGGVLMCWGYNVEGGLGDGSTTHPERPGDHRRPGSLLELSIDDVTVNEGDSGPSIATFTVSLSAASTQAVTVDVATARRDGDRARRLCRGLDDPSLVSPADHDADGRRSVVGDTRTSRTSASRSTDEPGERLVFDVIGVGTIHNDDGTPPVVDCDSGDDLAAEIAAAPAGATLNIAGTCVGTSS